MYRIGLKAVAVFLLVLTVGCDTKKIALEPATIRPAVVSAPVSVDVYYAPDLLNYACIGGKGYIDLSWTFELGPPSVQMFNPIFSALFDRAEFPGSIASQATSNDRIELSLTRFTGCDARWPIIGTTRIEIGYEAVAKSADGNELARWQGNGSAGSYEAPTKKGSVIIDAEIIHLRELTEVAMRKAAADFIVNFENSSSVRSWIDR